ncbi:hypothetical protein K9N68_26935 [Kovacikia minuta CCNUW1]|nr:Hsp70 family protein [Kovacikia minuta]UBF25220.1 hypothetical protein K9N68_26935 [Kovacikia minuta CCNUW1]
MEAFSEGFTDNHNQYEKLIELKNQADCLFYSYEATLRDHEEFIPGDLKSQAIEKVADLKAAIAYPAVKVEEVQQRLDALQEILRVVNASVYRYIQQIPSRENDEFEAWIGDSQDATIPFAMPDQVSNFRDENDFGEDDDCTPLGVRPRIPRQPNNRDDNHGFADESNIIP